VDVPAYVVAMKRRWVANGLPDYPLWIAAVIDSAALTTAVVAVLQRGTDALPISLLLTLLALSPWPLELWWQGRTWPAFALVTGGATAALMVTYPVEYDFAPLFLVLMTGHVTACVGVWRGLAVLAAGEAVVIGLAVEGTLPAAAATIWAVAMVIGLDMGFVMRSQQLRIEAQAREAVTRAEQAAADERQRIAREVHDLVAHSLSVTMLHLTAARRDLETGGDVADAADALREAERVGRQAVSDVRRTVGLLGQPGGIEPPAPTVADLSALVDVFRSAGLKVSLDVLGNAAEVPPGTALGLYRVVQESLANVAKHAPGSAASVRLDLASDPGTLTIRNPLLPGWTRSAGGSGLRGMAERADLLGATLTAGPDRGDWRVSMVLPRGDTVPGASEQVCPLPRLARTLRQPAVGPT
jgi:signal transduction histidine kinase